MRFYSGLLIASCAALTGCAQRAYTYQTAQFTQFSYSEFAYGPCAPVFSSPHLPPDMADPELGCATKENLRATLVNPSDLKGRYNYPPVEGNRAIIPVTKLKSSTPDHAGLSSVSAMGGGYDTSAKAPVAQAAQAGSK